MKNVLRGGGLTSVGTTSGTVGLQHENVKNEMAFLRRWLEFFGSNSAAVV